MHGRASRLDTEQAKTALTIPSRRYPPLRRNSARPGTGFRSSGPAAGRPRRGPESPFGIPVSPPEIVVGIPNDLLRRRPDVKSAEYQAAAQSAQIGVAKADLYPAFSLTGCSVSFRAT